MIVKKVIFKQQQKSNFKSLAEYILDTKNDNAKILIDYMLDSNNEMEKVEVYQFSNCSFEDRENNIKEIINTQRLNTTSKQDKTMHLVISFQEDERPSLEIMRAIEEEFARALGMEHHQRLSVVHSNTNNLHIHIAINKVDPDTLKIINPYNDIKILQETAIKLEAKFGLKVDNHISNDDRQQDKYNKHTMTCSFEIWVKNKIQDKVIELLNSSETTFDDLKECLASYDLEFRERRKGFVISSKSEKLFCKASSIHRFLSKQALEKRFGILNLSPVEIKQKQEKFNKFEGLPPNPLYEKYKKVEELKQRQLSNELNFIKLRRNELKKLSREVKHDRSTILYSKSQRKALYQKTKEIYFKYKRSSFRDFLLSEALNGNQEAVIALRRSKSKIDLSENTLSSKQDNPAILEDMKFVTKEGLVVYGDEKNKIIDKGKFLKISMRDDDKELILKSLLVAMERFGRVLDVTGDYNFKKNVLDVTNEFNLDIVFKDQSMQNVNIANRSAKNDLAARRKLQEITKMKLEIIKKTSSVKDDDKAIDIKKINKFIKKISTTKSNLFPEEVSALGLKDNKLDMTSVNISTSGFLVNEANVNGLRAMHNAIRQELKGVELDKFSKFLYIFENTDKVTDVAMMFYENRNIDVHKYMEKYKMTLSTLNRQANVINLSNEANLKIINEFFERTKIEYQNMRRKSIEISI